MSLTEKLAGRYDLPVFLEMWDWITARFIASAGQLFALLAMPMSGGAATTERMRITVVETILYP
jgi:hypothetical protein